MSDRFSRLSSLLTLASLASLGTGFHEVSDAELARDPSAEPPPIDFAPLAAAGRQVAAWLCDVARSRTDDPLDLTAIDRVDRAARALLGGEPASGGGASEQDVLTVLGILITAFEVDFGLDGLAQVAGAVYDAADRADPATTHGPIGAAIRAALGVQATSSVPAPTTPRPRVLVPVVIRRRPRTAHGADEDQGIRPSVLIIR